MKRAERGKWISDFLHWVIRCEILSCFRQDGEDSVHEFRLFGVVGCKYVTKWQKKAAVNMALVSIYVGSGSGGR